ncbi:MAG: glutamate--tRNA ligase family protein [Gemmatimonas sp.]
MTGTSRLRTESSTHLARAIARSLAHHGLSPGWRTRFAPAPTGLMHLGHVVNALHVWGIARAHGGQVLVRIENHDRTRSRPEFERALLEDLAWLGFLDHDTPVFRQSDRLSLYQSAVSGLAERGLEYGCICTRRDIAELVGTQFGEEPAYPGTCAEGGHVDAVARRVRVSNESERFDDMRLGAQGQTPATQCGDFLIRDRNGNFTYQLCVTVDDFDQRVDVVIRGEDLLSSTGRQLQLARMLGRGAAPAFLHHQLLMRADGLKLSKSLGDTGVREMRDAGMSPEQVLGRAAHACGLLKVEHHLSVADCAGMFTEL